MSLSANFPTTRPSLLLDFVNSGQMDPRITFSRASGATWFNSAGTLVGVDSSSTSLTVGTGWQTLTLTATAGVDRSWTVGTSVLLSASTVTNTMTGVVVSYTASTQVLVVSVASVVGSGTYSTWSVSNLMPRLDYNPSTLAAQGLLIEEARTNLLLQSADFATTWTLQRGTVTANALVAPDGTTSGDTFAGNGASGGSQGIYQIVTASASTAYVISVFAKAGTTNWITIQGFDGTTIPRAWFNISAGTVGVVESGMSNGQIVSVGNGWFRCSVVRTTGASATSLRPQFGLATADGTEASSSFLTMNLWGAQTEAGAFPTSYIPTTTTALTRSVDVASVNTLSPWYNQTEGTVYAELQSLSPLTSAQSVALGKYPHLWHIEAGASDSNVFWYGLGAEAYISTTYNNIGVVPSGINKFAVSLAPTAAQSRSSLNGAAAVNRNGTLTGTATGFFLGRDSTAGLNNFLNGYLRRITYYPTRLSNAQLQAITA